MTVVSKNSAAEKEFATFGETAKTHKRARCVPMKTLAGSELIGSSMDNYKHLRSRFYSLIPATDLLLWRQIMGLTLMVISNGGGGVAVLNCRHSSALSSRLFMTWR